MTKSSDEAGSDMSHSDTQAPPQPAKAPRKAFTVAAMASMLRKSHPGLNRSQRRAMAKLGRSGKSLPPSNKRANVAAPVLPPAKSVPSTVAASGSIIAGGTPVAQILQEENINNITGDTPT